MDGEMNFDFINSTYFHVFGISMLESFLQRRPAEGVRKWKCKRYATYFLNFIILPTLMALIIVGIYVDTKPDVESLAFSVSCLMYFAQEAIQVGFYILKIRDFRSFCLKFERFHTSRHRPIFCRRLLGERARGLRKTARMCYIVTCITFIMWLAIPLVVQPAMYLLREMGVVNSGPDSIIPKIFPFKYPLEMTTTRNRIIIAIFDFIALDLGALYFIPLHLFFVTIVMMICAQFEVMNFSVLNVQELAASIDRDYSALIGLDDDVDPIKIKLLLKDHQEILRITRNLRNIMNSFFGLEMCNVIITVAALAIGGATLMRTAGSVYDGLRRITGPAASITSIMSILLLYSWTCGRLKESEASMFNAMYSTNWYGQDREFKGLVLSAMTQSLKPMPIRMFNLGDMQRETFITGLKAVYSYYSFFTNVE